MDVNGDLPVPVSPDAKQGSANESAHSDASATSKASAQPNTSAEPKASAKPNTSAEPNRPRSSQNLYSLPLAQHMATGSSPLSVQTLQGSRLMSQNGDVASPEASNSSIKSWESSGDPARSGTKSKSPARSDTKSRSPFRSGTKSRSPALSGTKSRSPARSGTKSRSPARSGTKSKSPARSGTKSRSPARSSNKSVSHPAHSRARSDSRLKHQSQPLIPSRSSSKYGSRSRFRFNHGSRSISRSASKSRSRSPSQSLSRNISAVVTRKRQRRLLSDSEEEDAQPSKKLKSSSSKRSRNNSVRSREGSHSSQKRHRGSDFVEKQNNHDGYSQFYKSVDVGDASNDNEVRPDKSKETFVNDFDAMRARKEEMMGGRRRKMNKDIINDNEVEINIMVNKMWQAAEQDRHLNQEGKPATKKLAIIDLVLRQIRKVDLLESFLDANVLTALTEWLSPMPDRSLPSGPIRDAIIKWLTNLPLLSQDILKTSGIGKALMFLYIHPRESRPNKERCGRLIAKWLQPILNNTDDFGTLTKDKRLERNVEMKKTGRFPAGKEETVDDSAAKILRPGDPGWCYRARVPTVARKAYVVRPESTIVGEVRCNVRTRKTKLDDMFLHFRQQKIKNSSKRAVKISMEGRNMLI